LATGETPLVTWDPEGLASGARGAEIAESPRVPQPAIIKQNPQEIRTDPGRLTMPFRLIWNLHEMETRTIDDVAGFEAIRPRVGGPEGPAG
jgi:hypothetical protein